MKKFEVVIVHEEQGKVKHIVQSDTEMGAREKALRAYKPKSARIVSCEVF